MSAEVVIPEWDDVTPCTANPLEAFVYSQEPAGALEEQKFRAGLKAAIEWVLQNRGTGS
jgi:hypothetical protein